MTDTQYSAGFNNGKRYEREAILDYIEHHAQATAQDIADEINARYEADMRVNLGGVEWAAHWRK
jgi:serine phosphatase RsbU (regulator of sigma subunit)